jgi:hypothetical protein
MIYDLYVHTMHSAEVVHQLDPVQHCSHKPSIAQKCGTYMHNHTLKHTRACPGLR